VIPPLKRARASLPLLFLTVAGIGAVPSVRQKLQARVAVRSTKQEQGSLFEADVSRLVDRHLWITIRLPASPGSPSRTIRYDAYRQVLSHYGDARRIPLSFTLAPAILPAGSGL
jgi:hypothetical protein